MQPLQSTIHLRVPAATKAAWVRQSRAAGMRLTDWITHAVEQAMPQAMHIVIPEGVTFADLRLSRDPATGDVAFDWAPIERICAESGLDVAAFRERSEEAVTSLLVGWYTQHVARGGARDACADDLVAEVGAEDARGGGISHAPGTA